LRPGRGSQGIGKEAGYNCKIEEENIIDQFGDGDCRGFSAGAEKDFGVVDSKNIGNQSKQIGRVETRRDKPGNLKRGTV
jgi:hypothetical protein